jgi:type I restriction enzyme S subunit
MDVRPGYKQTDVGVIPLDWEPKTLGDFVSLRRGHDLTVQHRRTGSVPVMGSAGQNGFHDTALAKGPGVLLGRSGASFGQAHFCEGDYWPHNTALYVTDFHSNVPRFVYYFLKSIDFRRHNSGGAQQSLNRNFIAPIPIAIPPTWDEQKAIAEALSDADALIESLEQLIAKKRQIKQGAMQELLTGKKRLSGYGNACSEFKDTELGPLPADWPVVEVRQVTRSHKQGYYTKERYVDSGVKLVRITDLMNPRIEYSTMPMLQLSASDHDAYKVNVGDFLFARSGAIGRYGIVYADEDAIFGSYIIRFSFDSTKMTNEFFGYLYETELVQKQLLSITQGSSNININAGNIKAIRIPSPQIHEQTSIAAMVSDIDADIAAQEAKRAKAQSIKQGMMQELLTGRIRLI